MTVEEFAGFERILGQKTIAVNDMRWARVRPFFYRPLLPYQEYQLGLVKPPSLGLIGGFQHVVPPDQESNSFLVFLMFEKAGTYSLDSLDYNRKRQVKQAAKQFVIQPMTDKNEFRQQVHKVYLSFYERTQYQFGSQRRDPVYFSRWTDALFQIPKIGILGAYQNGVLRGVSISLLVKDTLIYAMFFCDRESLRLGLSDLMLHTVRERAASTGCAGQIFAGMYKGRGGLDDFYLLRGCSKLVKPAFLHLNPLAAFVLKRLQPDQYSRLRGDIATSTTPDAAATNASSKTSPAQDPPATIQSRPVVPENPESR